MTELEIQVVVNREQKRWKISVGDLLIDVLRRERYFGVKRGCQTGECGSCTVLLQGNAVNSCLMLAVRADECELVTIEGLSQGADLHAVQRRFLECGAVQCGFCTPGMILNTVALINRQPSPTEAEVRDMLKGNLCRCTGYRKPIDAVLAAAREPDQEAMLARSLEVSVSRDEEKPVYQVVGQSELRVDGSDLVRGVATFTDYVDIPGILHGRILHSPHARAGATCLACLGTCSVRAQREWPLRDQSHALAQSLPPAYHKRRLLSPNRGA